MDHLGKYSLPQQISPNSARSVEGPQASTVAPTEHGKRRPMHQRAQTTGGKGTEMVKFFYTMVEQYRNIGIPIQKKGLLGFRVIRVLLELPTLPMHSRYSIGTVLSRKEPPVLLRSPWLMLQLWKTH